MAEIIVTSTADSGAGSLRQAIADANDGDVILFDSDVFPAGQTTSILLSSYITVNKSVSIYGGFNDGNGGYTSGATKRYYVYRDVEGTRTKVVISDPDDAQEDETVLFENVCRVALDGQATQAPDAEEPLDGWSGNRLCFIRANKIINVIMSGVAFQNAVSSATQTGACIYSSPLSSLIAPTVLLNECAFKYSVNTTGTGGAITLMTSAIITILNCSFSDIKSHTAGIYFPGLASATVVGCVFDLLWAKNAAGAFYISSSNPYEINNCRFVNCEAYTAGCCILYSNSTGVFRNCTFDTSNAVGNGGALFSQGVSAGFYNCVFKNNAANNGGGVYLYTTSTNIFNDCAFIGCSAKTSGGGFFSGGSSQNTLTDCIISNCSAIYGGGFYSRDTSQNTLNGCTVTNCSATTYGGGVYSISTSQNTLNDCVMSACSASNGGAINATATSVNTLNNCTITNCTATTGGGFYVNTTGVTTFDSCVFDSTSSLSFANTAQVAFAGGVTQMGVARLNAATFNFSEGSALTITDAATIGAATFTSEGRGYLAVTHGINTSAATLTNVVLCAYGADVSSFAEVDGVLEWDAANPTTTVLIERADGDSWTTVTQTAGESLTLYLPPSDTVRLFDGVQFFTAQAPSQRTYYYIGGAEGSFTSAADWSLRRGGVAITEPPVVAGQRFIVGDISSGE